MFHGLIWLFVRKFSFMLITEPLLILIIEVTNAAMDDDDECEFICWRWSLGPPLPPACQETWDQLLSRTPTASTLLTVGNLTICADEMFTWIYILLSDQNTPKFSMKYEITLTVVAHTQKIKIYTINRSMFSYWFCLQDAQNCLPIRVWWKLIWEASLRLSKYSLSQLGPANGGGRKIQLTNGGAGPIFNLPMAAHMVGWVRWSQDLMARNKIAKRRCCETAKLLLILLNWGKFQWNFLLAGCWFGGGRPWP